MVFINTNLNLFIIGWFPSSGWCLNKHNKQPGREDEKGLTKEQCWKKCREHDRFKGCEYYTGSEGVSWWCRLITCVEERNCVAYTGEIVKGSGSADYTCYHPGTLNQVITF